MVGNPFAVAFVAVRVESRPGPLHRPTSARRQSSAIEDLGSDPLQEWLSYAPPFLSGKRPCSLWRRTIQLSERPTPRGRHSETRERRCLSDRKSTRLNSSHRCISYAV